MKYCSDNFWEHAFSFDPNIDFDFLSILGKEDLGHLSVIRLSILENTFLTYLSDILTMLLL